MSEKTPITKENAVEELHKVFDTLQEVIDASKDFQSRVVDPYEIEEVVSSDEELELRGNRIFEELNGLGLLS